MAFRQLFLFICLICVISTVALEKVTTKTTKKSFTTSTRKTSTTKPVKNVKNFRSESKNEPQRKIEGSKVKSMNELMDFDTWAVSFFLKFRYFHCQLYFIQKKYDKTYDNYVKSKAEARKAFKENSKNIKSHNSRRNETYQRKLQSHSDLTYEEKKAYRMGLSQTEVDANFTVKMFNTSKPSKQVNYTEWFPPARGQIFRVFQWFGQK
jgi:hypothetical protein